MAGILQHQSRRLVCAPGHLFLPRLHAASNCKHHPYTYTNIWRLNAVQSQSNQTKSKGGRPDVSDSPFADLGLEEFEEVPAVRVRQHVNPLRREFQIPHEPLVWHEAFADPNKPLLVDIGCGSGRFLLKRQKLKGQEQNALGIEIRRALVRRANKWAELLQLNSCVHYVFANATVSLSSLLSTYPGPVVLFTIQMPDPQFKKRHKKRRVVQPQLVQDIARLLAPGGHVFLQSDVEEVAVDMRNLFEQYASDVLSPAQEHSNGPVFFSNEVFVKRGPPTKKTASTDAASNNSSDVTLDDDESSEQGSSSTGGTSGTSTSTSSTEAELQADCSTVDGAGLHVAQAGTFEDSQVLTVTTHSASSRLPEHSAEHVVDTDSTSNQEADGTEAGIDDDIDTREISAIEDSSGDECDPEEAEFQSQWRKQGWLLVNPMGIPTEREHFALSEGGQVFRVLLSKPALAP